MSASSAAPSPPLSGIAPTSSHPVGDTSSVVLIDQACGPSLGLRPAMEVSPALGAQGVVTSSRRPGATPASEGAAAGGRPREASAGGGGGVAQSGAVFVSIPVQA
ncbi:hypothetical protein TSOC_000580 [Tetrabaena socialis]|uniref:Uncharacterized protein n=1 Tax=Tetrabaena socialis TaxID=47790 RepID=A0A2J8AJ06_9CHLO|nr:hypothetical protein TSOC_000580 [Tetrabaena socialis]|eukprot:PNH12502.1 hypothetical protein TSOC_000580 [Tetrabaena socialis]